MTKEEVIANIHATQNNLSESYIRELGKDAVIGMLTRIAVQIAKIE